MIDISCVQTFHSEQDIRALVAEAIAGDYIAAHTLPFWVPLTSELLAGSNTRAGSPVGFPSGGTATAVKVTEAAWLIDAGVQEMDIVMNVGLLKSGRSADATTDVAAVIEAVDGRVPVKVILEVGYLEGEELERAAEAMLAAGTRSLKTGTGWSGVPTSVDHVSRIRAVAGPDIEIKASGGVRTLADVTALFDAGARRFGANATSAAAIVAEARA
jgi:deoxyribose-phosphate aldolase